VPSSDKTISGLYERCISGSIEIFILGVTSLTVSAKALLKLLKPIFLEDNEYFTNEYFHSTHI